jgi:hypothetical protein
MNVQSATAIANYYQQSSTASAVSVAQALSAIKLNPRAKFTLQDSAANIENNLASLAAMNNNLTSVTLTDQAPGFITVTSKQLLTGTVTALTNKMNLGGANKISLNVVDALAKDIANLKPATTAKIGQVSIKDTTVNITSKFDSLGVFEGKLGNIQLTDPAKFLKLTQAQYTSNTGVLNHLVGTFGLEISGATTAQAIAMSSDVKIAKVNIVDHAQNIADNLDGLQAMGLKVNSIKSDDTTVFKVSGEQLKKDAAVIGKIYKGYQLAVFNIDASTALSVKSNKKIITLDVVDTAEGISKNLALLSKLGTQLHSLQITDNKPLSMTASDYFKSDAILRKVVDVPGVSLPKTDGPVDPVTDPADVNFNNNYQLDILDSTAVDAQTIKNNPRIASISIKDTSAAISINLNDLDSNTLVKDIVVTNTNSAINVSYSQLSTEADAIGLLKSKNGTLKFNVKGVTAADAKALLNDASKRVATLSVSDTAANIGAKLSDLTSLGKNLTTIVQTDARTQSLPGNPLNLTANEWMLHIGTLSKIEGGYGVNLKSVGAEKALSLANDVRVKSFEVLDSAAAISSNFDTLQSLGAKLTAVKQSDSAAIEITGRQYSAPSNILSKLDSTYKLSVRNAQANQISTMVQDVAHVSSFKVLDTVDNIASNLTALQTAATTDELSNNINVSIAGALKPFTLSVTDLDTYADALNVIQSNYKVNVTDIAAANAKAFAENESLDIHTHLQSMTVKGTSAEFSNKSLIEDLNSLGNKISAIKQNDSGGVIAISQSDWEINNNVFAKINGYRVSLSGVTASGAMTLLQNEHVAKVQVADTGAQISVNFGSLMDLGESITSIKQNADDTSHLQLSMALWKTGTETLAKIESNYTVDLSDATAAEAALAANTSNVASIAIKDSAVKISSSFDTLSTNVKISSIVLTGAVEPIQITQTQLDAGSVLLDTIQGGYSLAIKNANVSAASDLNANTHVTSVEMSGTASEISDALSDLHQFGPKLNSLSVTGNDPSMSLSYVDFQKYKNVLGLIPQNFHLELTDVRASDAITQDLDSQFDFSFKVKDSAVQIASNIAGLESLQTKLAEITTIEELPVLKMKAADYLANQDVLAKINTDSSGLSYQLELTGGDVSFARSLLEDAALAETISSLDITDTALTISNNFDLISDDKILNARLTVGTMPLSLTGTQYSNTTSLSKVRGTFDINVKEAALTQTSTLEADTRVLSYSLTTTSSLVGDSLPDVLGLSKLDRINITQDATAMTLTMADYVLVEESLGKLVGNYGLEVTGVLTSEIDTLSSKNEVSSIQIEDSSPNISSDWDALVALGNKLTSIDVSTDQTPVAIHFDQLTASAATLAKLPADQSLALIDVPPDQATTSANLDNVATVSVKGRADQISFYFSSLVNLDTQLDTIEVSDANPVELTQAQIDANSSTLAKFMGSHQIQVIS